MAKPKDISAFPGDMARVSRTFGPAMVSTFNETVRRSKPKFNAAARKAAGSDRKLSRLGHKSGPMTAKFRITQGHTQTLLYINAAGPWGIRDNTDVGGKTVKHEIRPKKAKRLRFEVDGEIVYARKVNHPGSVRRAYWGEGRDEALRVAQKRVEPEVRKAIVAALNGQMYSTRPIPAG